ncbi:MAG: hypothetical protein IIB90_15405 [Gemmatimonadetes bacterium]|nr:hypothetical protein [Gemmatimonadota bacterium]
MTLGLNPFEDEPIEERPPVKPPAITGAIGVAARAAARVRPPAPPPIEPLDEMPPPEILAKNEAERQKRIAEGKPDYWIEELKAWQRVEIEPKDAWKEALREPRFWAVA